MSGGAPGLQNQRGVRKGSRWVRFPFTSAIFLAGAIASLVYGMKYHTQPVLEEYEEEVEIPVPSPFGPMMPPGEIVGPPGMPGAGFPGEPPYGDPVAGPLAPPFFGPAPQEKMKAIRVVQKTKDVREPRLVFEVTVGGVVRLDSGELKQTYSGEAGPALCPT